MSSVLTKGVPIAVFLSSIFLVYARQFFLEPIRLDKRTILADVRLHNKMVISVFLLGLIC